MAVADSLQSRARANPRRVTAVLSLVGYVLVALAFAPMAPFPSISNDLVIVLGDAIAVVNAVNVLVIAAGWRWIRRDEVRKHAAAMATSFLLILVFLVLYLTKIGGGGTKEFVGPTLVYYPYLAMLAVHIVLSIVSVPVVVYALVLGVTHSPSELRNETPHRRVGRVAAASWLLSLALGVVTYLLLNHAFSWEYVESAAATLLLF